MTRGATAAASVASIAPSGGMKLRKSGSYPLMPAAEVQPASRREKGDFQIMVLPLELPL